MVAVFSAGIITDSDIGVHVWEVSISANNRSFLNIVSFFRNYLEFADLFKIIEVKFFVADQMVVFMPFA